jgi:hypothetical protein
MSSEAPIPWPLLDEILPCLFQAKAEQLTQVCEELVEWRAVDGAKRHLPATTPSPYEQCSWPHPQRCY